MDSTIFLTAALPIYYLHTSLVNLWVELLQCSSCFLLGGESFDMGDGCASAPRVSSVIEGPSIRFFLYISSVLQGFYRALGVEVCILRKFIQKPCGEGFFIHLTALVVFVHVFLICCLLVVCLSLQDSRNRSG